MVAGNLESSSLELDSLLQHLAVIFRKNADRQEQMCRFNIGFIFGSTFLLTLDWILMLTRASDS